MRFLGQLTIPMKLFLFRQISIDNLGYISYVVGINTNTVEIQLVDDSH